jgi:hypothetical protein
MIGGFELQPHLPGLELPIRVKRDHHEVNPIVSQPPLDDPATPQYVALDMIAAEVSNHVFPGAAFPLGVFGSGQGIFSLVGFVLASFNPII